MKQIIKVDFVNTLQTITIEFDDGLEYMIDLTIKAHIEDFGFGVTEMHGSISNHVDLGWEIDGIEVSKAFVRAHKFDCFAEMPDSSLKTIQNEIESGLELGHYELLIKQRAEYED